MRKLKKGRKFGRVRNQRNALLKSLATALVLRGKIKTTLPKAKELRPHIERLITYAKKGAKAGIGFRLLQPLLPQKTFLRLIKEIAPRYTQRRGGYTRIIKLPSRARDAAKMAIIEFV